jgi:hypothetical protein
MKQEIEVEIEIEFEIEIEVEIEFEFEIEVEVEIETEIEIEIETRHFPPLADVMPSLTCNPKRFPISPGEEAQEHRCRALQDLCSQRTMCHTPAPHRTLTEDILTPTCMEHGLVSYAEQQEQMKLYTGRCCSR